MENLALPCTSIYIYHITHIYIYMYIYVRYYRLLAGWFHSDSKTSNKNSSPLKRPKNISISFILPVCREQKQHNILNSIPNLPNVWIISLQCTQSCSSLEAIDYRQIWFHGFWCIWAVVPSEKLCENLVVNSRSWAPHLWLSGPGNPILGAWMTTGRTEVPSNRS